MKTILIFCSCLLFTATTIAQQSGNVSRKSGNANRSPYLQQNSNYDYNTTTRKPQGIEPNAQIRGKVVELDVNVLSNQKADSYIAIFNLTQMGKTVDETNRLLTDRYNGFAEELQGVGVPKSNIYLDMVTFVPLYEYETEKKLFTKTHNEIPKGFEMQQNVHIKYTDASMMAKILAVAAKYEIYDLVKVDYAVDNQEAVLVEMREKAVDHLVKQIELYVEKMGVDLESGYRIVAEEKKVIFPTDRYASYSAFSNVSLGGTTDKGKTVDMYKPQTMFYDKVNYDNFDIVLNPAPLEPAIQFLYTMKIQIAIKDPNQPTKNYIWMTPDGDLVPIQPEEK
jgi:uncharacterized protein YggE